MEEETNSDYFGLSAKAHVHLLGGFWIGHILGGVQDWNVSISGDVGDVAV